MEGGDGDGSVGMDEVASISESWGIGSIEACTTTGDADRTCSCGLHTCACEVRTRVSKEDTFDSKADIVLCAAACCACN
jgi:hypothetical protein